MKNAATIPLEAMGSTCRRCRTTLLQPRNPLSWRPRQRLAGPAVASDRVVSCGGNPSQQAAGREVVGRCAPTGDAPLS
jgi:hypothetical protein